MVMPQATSRWTAAMVRALPDDGKRYEVIDGELFVTPAPSLRNQRALALLFEWLRSCATGAAGVGEVLWSPADISTRDDRLVQPDVFVIPTVPGQPPLQDWSDVSHLLLAVEVLSPSTARADRQVKPRLYREIADEYWIVDLDGRVVERWRRDDQRPEIITDRLAWQPAGGELFELALGPFFDRVGPG